ncbi:MAG TPA: flagellar assembly protein FliW [Conexibacter sp.]|nr:flagellar assembly protein FliW [Conexibacter sp.]
MPTTIDSTRFGRIEVAPDSAIAFPHGLAGLDSRRFTLVARAQDDAFVWLHSLEDPALALPLADPTRFFADFALEPAEGEEERLGLAAGALAEATVFVTVRASERLEDFTANLRAPLAIVDGVGHQLLNQAPGAELRAPLFAELAAAAERAA